MSEVACYRQLSYAYCLELGHKNRNDLKELSPARISAPTLRTSQNDGSGHWSELATLENALFEFDPTRRTVPTTNTRITANITAYSAMSWPSSSRHSLRSR
jgi:hypothetical protein